MPIRDRFRASGKPGPTNDPTLRSMSRQWQDAWSAWLRAEDALVEFREEFPRDARPVTDESLRELLEAGELLRERRDHAYERVYGLDRQREAAGEAAPQQEWDSARR